MFKGLRATTSALGREIDGHLYLGYPSTMTTRQRPPACSSVTLPPMAMAESDREKVIRINRALSDAKRLEIFLLLAGQEKPTCACDIVDRFHLRQPTISHHMKVLADAGLVAVSRQGVWAYYELSGQGIRALVGLQEMLSSERSVAAE
jgi:ArsR family transcriptional regulator, arsenate/arsenite/antimonite-responsive transcriptional repressor